MGDYVRIPPCFFLFPFLSFCNVAVLCSIKTKKKNTFDNPILNSPFAYHTYQATALTEMRKSKPEKTGKQTGGQRNSKEEEEGVTQGSRDRHCHLFSIIAGDMIDTTLNTHTHTHIHIQRNQCLACFYNI
ncbi:hypothetical protein B0O80DRAFT_445865 [Mortierella sp. GBAus27b]|nr:hypothetical protein B0O80DRAFT_445865 [Mortierella sp. GBAus27b]